MTRTPHPLLGPFPNAPDAWQAELPLQLAPEEQVVAALETDLDVHLVFSPGQVVLTNRRLLARSPGDADWTAWPLRPGLSLQHHDHAGVGTLELHDATARLACWRFTLAHNVAALRLNDRFAAQLASHLSGQPVEHTDETVCPTCKALLEPDQEECPICSRELHEVPSTWTLFRLWRFARPYRNQLLAGFLLTLASTGATLVPPYLTMPLMDKVLIPYQERPSDRYRRGGAAARRPARRQPCWPGAWAGRSTYILALVSERIGADLRTTTYEHLLQLSLEYFGGKRTGDLMARIGSETDRICVFLSLHLLDFVTDVLMIVHDRG